jgi:hypothetical protein
MMESLFGSSPALQARCPAAAYGIGCSGKEACHKIGEVSPGEYGRIVRMIG